MSPPAPRPTPEQLKLAEEHLPLALRSASQFYRRVPWRSCDLIDLESEAWLGLVDAARTFDPSRGVPFTTHARNRVWGRMKDYLRNLDHLGRAHRQRVKAGELNDTAVKPIDGSLPDARAEPPAYRQQLRDELELVLRGLGRVERLVVLLYHMDGLTMKEVGRVVHKSESRVSQIHTNVMARMRERAAHYQRQLQEV